MGKNSKKPRQLNRNHHDSSAIKKNFSNPRVSRKNILSKKNGKAQKQQVKPVIPFRPSDRILLVGEGDFSFALSVVQHHRCRHVTATCYDSEDELHRKYPQTRDILDQLLSYNGDPDSGDKKPSPSEDQVLNRDDESQGDVDLTETSSSEWEGFSPKPTSSENNHPSSNHSASTPANGSSLTSKPPTAPPSSSSPSTTITTNPPSNSNSHSKNTISFHHSISATALPTHKPLRQHSPYNKIIFNFPHVGGLSTDVNRQVRANQELLVAFFQSSQSLLASRSNPVRTTKSTASQSYSDDDDFESEERSPRDEADGAAATTGQILLTLFEGEPYTLWNIRDLARHCGFRVVTSYRFPWEAYPGYRHARTLGAIVKKGMSEEVQVDGDKEGKKKKSGPWKGEEREARGYVFEMVDVEPGSFLSGKKKKKRRRGSSSSGSE